MTKDQELRQLKEWREKLLSIVEIQADDPGLWCMPIGRKQTIGEAYLQQELRKLYRVIEGILK